MHISSVPQGGMRRCIWPGVAAQMKMGVCAGPNSGSTQRGMNQGEIFFKRRAARGGRFAKIRGLRETLRLPAELRKQPD